MILYLKIRRLSHISPFLASLVHPVRQRSHLDAKIFGYLSQRQVSTARKPDCIPFELIIKAP
jgi:hypothetical protein